MSIFLEFMHVLLRLAYVFVPLFAVLFLLFCTDNPFLRALDRSVDEQLNRDVANAKAMYPQYFKK